MTSDSVVAAGDGLFPPMTSENTDGSFGEAGDGDADGVAGVGVGVAVVVGDPDTEVFGETVAEGAGAGSAWAGELVTAGSNAIETISAATSAVVFRIEFTMCLS